MKIGNFWNADKVPDEKRWSSLTLFLKEIYTILNRGFVFQDNFRGAILEVTFSSSNTDVTIKHGLAYTPTNYLVLSRTTSITIYDGSQTPDQVNFYLRASGTGSCNVLIF